jgi:hypothetical protein
MTEVLSPPWTGGGANTGMPGQGGALAEAWPPAAQRHESSPAAAKKREGEHREPIPSLIRAMVAVWQLGDGGEVVAGVKLERGGKKCGGVCGEDQRRHLLL